MRLSDYKKHNEKYFLKKRAKTLRDLRNNGGYLIAKGTVVVIERKYQGFQISIPGEALRDHGNGSFSRNSISRVSYADLELIESTPPGADKTESK